MQLECYGRTHPGSQKAQNEDAFLVFIPHNESLFRRKGALFAVADGVGSLAQAAKASKQALEIIRDTYYSSPQSPQEALKEAFIKAHQSLVERARKQGVRMGTTATVLVLFEKYLVAGQVGNSRLYSYPLKEKRLKALTPEHSIVSQLVAEGVLRPEEASTHPKRHVITQALGVKVAPFVQTFPVVPGYYLLLTDGLLEVFSEEEISAFLRRQGPPSSLVPEMVERALKRGPRDDLTLLLIRVVDTP